MPAQTWQERTFERDVHTALAIIHAEERAAAWGLVRAVVELAIEDLRSARGGVLEDAARYFAEPAGELARWHCDVLGLDVAAVRQRAQALLAERFGSEAAADLWERVSRVSLPAARRGRRRRRTRDRTAVGAAGPVAG